METVELLERRKDWGKYYGMGLLQSLSGVGGSSVLEFEACPTEVDFLFLILRALEGRIEGRHS